MATVRTGSSPQLVNRNFSHTVKLVQNDTLPQISMTLINETDDEPIDLTSVASMLLKFKAEGGSTIKESVPVYRIAPYASGNVFFEWSDETLDTAGAFTGELELTYSNGKVRTVFNELRFEIRSDY